MILRIPMRVVCERNQRQHRMALARKTKQQRAVVLMACNAHPAMAKMRWCIKNRQGLVVTLTRIAPGTLDDDGLRDAFKACRDSVATAVGLDKKDNDPRLVWKYAQRKGRWKTKTAPAEYGIEIELSQFGELEWAAELDEVLP